MSEENQRPTDPACDVHAAPRKAYTCPQVIEFGSVQGLTRGGSFGPQADPTPGPGGIFRTS